MNTSLKHIFMCVLIVGAWPAAAASAKQDDCASEVLGARYSIAMTQSKNGKQETSEHEFNLWRKGDLVVHEDGRKKIAELWHKLPNGFISMTRYFDTHQRAINYHSVDLNNGRGEKNWLVKYQIVSDALLQSMTLKESHGEGCLNVEHYLLSASSPDQASLSIEWYPHLRLVHAYMLTNDTQSLSWTLNEIVHDPAIVMAQFDKWQAYDDTDYADVGDNESDPFLQKMINMGFIEHGASGVYDAGGHGLGGHAH